MPKSHGQWDGYRHCALGAKLDGVLRQHMRMRDGTLRDTCVYSIIAPEWPAVRSNLTWKLAQPSAESLR